jgi:predicted PurR-regulated permease PerM
MIEESIAVAPSGNPFRQSIRVLGLFVRSQLIIAGIDTVLYAVGFVIAHVPWWPLFALVGGICSIIPSIGSLIPLTLVGVTMLLADRGWTNLAIAFGTWVVVQVLESFVLQPFLLSKPLGLRTLPVFLALFTGGLLLGPVGFVLAVPVLAVASVFWRYFRDRDLERPPGKHDV